MAAYRLTRLKPHPHFLLRKDLSLSLVRREISGFAESADYFTKLSTLNAFKR